MYNGGNRLLGGLVSLFIAFIFIFSLASIKPGNINPRLPKYVYIHRESDPEFKIILLWNTFKDPSFGFRLSLEQRKEFYFLFLSFREGVKIEKSVFKKKRKRYIEDTFYFVSKISKIHPEVRFVAFGL